MLDLVVVVFEKEVSMLALQARSIARFGRDIDRIVIINNAQEDTGIEPLYQRIRNEVIPCYGELADRVVLHDVKQLLGRTYGVQGWESQQILKLKSGDLCTSGNVVLLLDAKNYFIKSFGLNTFVHGNRLCTRIGGMEDWSREQYENSCSVWGLTKDQIEDCAIGLPGINTPWPIHTDVLRSCAASYAELYGEFETDPVIQFEFYIMSAFIHHRFGRIQNYFENSDTVIASRKHRTEWATLTAKDRENILRYMINNDLFDSESAKKFIDKIQQDINLHP